MLCDTCDNKMIVKAQYKTGLFTTKDTTDTASFCTVVGEQLMRADIVKCNKYVEKK